MKKIKRLTVRVKKKNCKNFLYAKNALEYIDTTTGAWLGNDLDKAVSLWLEGHTIEVGFTVPLTCTYYIIGEWKRTD